jgi:hypothetical protein
VRPKARFDSKRNELSEPFVAAFATDPSGRLPTVAEQIVRPFVSVVALRSSNRYAASGCEILPMPVSCEEKEYSPTRRSGYP